MLESLKEMSIYEAKGSSGQSGPEQLPMASPAQIKERLPLSKALALKVEAQRQAVKRILHGLDERFWSLWVPVRFMMSMPLWVCSKTGSTDTPVG